MRIHRPVIDVISTGVDHALPERLGGMPFGLAEGDWPRCAECGRSQSLLAQLAHHPERLDLGREGRMLLVFQCAHDPGMCATWEAFSGANACLIVEPERLGAGETALPDDGPPLDPAVVIRGWREEDDGLDQDLAPAFFDEASWLALDDAVAARATSSTRLGGVPHWVQSPDEAPRPGWRFVGQLDSGYSFLAPPSGDAGTVRPDPEGWEGRTHWAPGPNFGDGGIAYLFVREGDDRPQAVMFWQCG